MKGITQSYFIYDSQIYKALKPIYLEIIKLLEKADTLQADDLQHEYVMLDDGDLPAEDYE